MCQVKIKIFGIVIVIAIGFFGFVATRNDFFRYESSGVIEASPDKIFPYISQFKLGGEWSPYEKGMQMPKSFGGNDGEVGSWMEFGPSDGGSGRLELLEIIPNSMVKINLHMTAPFEAKNTVIYRLTPEASGTRFSWSMEGHGGYIGKLMSVLIDCEKMVTSQFLQGIANLKTLVESKKN